MQDPNALFVAPDGLEYWGVGDYLLGKPVVSYRTTRIQEMRAEGKGEQVVRAWIAWHDHPGEPTPAEHHAAYASAPGGPEGTRSAGAVQAPADPLHAAN